MRCVSPLTLKSGDIVPCGKCAPCLNRHLNQWQFRIQQEAKYATSSWFLTLTYADKNLRYSRGIPVVSLRDVQLYFKRLRKRHDTVYVDRFGNRGNNVRFSYGGGYEIGNIRYFAVAEYGAVTKRPHYHILLFNAELKHIDMAWNLGQIYYGKVNGASIGYVLKYMFKPSKFKCHVPQFGVMSKGLGDCYLSPKMFQYHKSDLVNHSYCTFVGGQKVAMPRYYRDMLYDELELEEIYASLGLENRESVVKTNDMLLYYKQKLEFDYLQNRFL